MLPRSDPSVQIVRVTQGREISDTMAADIRAAFQNKRYTFADEDLAERCASLAEEHTLTPEAVALEFERIMMTRHVTDARLSLS